jgi:hypothetical protein
MTQHERHGRLLDAMLEIDLSRREFLTRFGLFTALAGATTMSMPGRAATQETTPGAAEVDQARLQGLTSLSMLLCGGGTFDPGRATMLLDLIDADPALKPGLDELLATPPAPTAALTSAAAQSTAAAILLYWYAGSFAGAPVGDRATAYYGLTAWQAMYTYPPSVCRGFGLWADPPQTAPVSASV